MGAGRDEAVEFLVEEGCTEKEASDILAILASGGYTEEASRDPSIPRRPSAFAAPLRSACGPLAVFAETGLLQDWADEVMQLNPDDLKVMAEQATAAALLMDSDSSDSSDEEEGEGEGEEEEDDQLEADLPPPPMQQPPPANKLKNVQPSKPQTLAKGPAAPPDTAPKPSQPPAGPPPGPPPPAAKPRLMAKGLHAWDAAAGAQAGDLLFGLGEMIEVRRLLDVLPCGFQLPAHRASHHLPPYQIVDMNKPGQVNTQRAAGSFSSSLMLQCGTS